ncbi:MAG: glycosyltransferase [Muribaculaceae bacterium]|jgi:glycosyltransferase involved in cell wall biosynthesis
MEKYSIIVPVYNRPAEVADLLESLAGQTARNFEVILVEDGSTVPCREIAERYSGKLDLKYFFKENEGRSIARNYGMERASGTFFIFFDSDCVIPADYFAKLNAMAVEKPFDCFGGPDAADESFSTSQKAINHAMTSFLTTGGIRGGKISLEKFTPRTFNMGFSRAVYNLVGGFREMFSEDIDMSTRIRLAGFSIGLYPDMPVYHKRRLDFRKFIRQVYVFGMSRITLKLLYPDTLKAVHWLPAIFVLGVVAMLLLAIFASPWWMLPLGIYLLAIFISALVSTHSVIIAAKAVPASLIQLGGYGCGFIKAYFLKIILGRGRNESEEIALRKGK